MRGLSFATASALFQVRSLSFCSPQGHVLLLADEEPGPNHLDFKLPAARGFVALHDSLGVELDRINYTNAIEGVSLGRLPDGSPALTLFQDSASPGAPNHLVSYSGALINEVMARNKQAVTNLHGKCPDWIELFNPGPGAFDTSGMSLSVGAPIPRQWVLPQGCSIPSNGHLVIWCDDSMPPSDKPDKSLNCGVELSGEGGGVYLFSSGGQLVDVVEYGFQLADMAIGRSGSEWALLSAPTPAAPNATPATLGDPAKVRINEWLASSEASDWLELYNPGPLPVSLSGLTLTDDPSLAGQTNHLIGPLTFIAGLGWVVYKADGDAGKGPDHLLFGLDALGETMRLYSRSFVTIDEVNLLPQERGVAEGRLPDGSTNLVRFPVSASPGAPNYIPLETVVINEALTHSDPPLEDAIEIHNLDQQLVNLGGWWLSDDPCQPMKLRLPDNAVLGGHGFLVFYEYQFNPAPGTAGSFELDSAHGGRIVLSETDPNGSLTGRQARAEYGAAEIGVPFGRHQTSAGADFVAMSRRTFGADNPQSLEEFRSGRGSANTQPKVGPLVIDEIMYLRSPTRAVKPSRFTNTNTSNCAISPPRPCQCSIRRVQRTRGNCPAPSSFHSRPACGLIPALSLWLSDLIPSTT